MDSPQGFKDIDHYIASFPAETQQLLEKVRRVIQEAAPDATEAISYQVPTFKFNGRNLVHFAAWKSHLGFYPVPSGLEAFKRELVPYKQAKGSVQFPYTKPIPYELIAEIVRYRVKEESK